MDELTRAKGALKINVINDFKSNVEKYHEQYGRIDGIRNDKVFYRVDNQLLKPLIDEFEYINNENKNGANLDYNYITYANDVIKAGVVPKHISCLLKQLRYYMDISVSDNGERTIEVEEDFFAEGEIPGEEDAYKEVLASQILNFYDCPTVYNAAVITKDYEGKDEYKLLSADFMKEGQYFSTFEELGIDLGDMDASLEKFSNFLDGKLKKLGVDEKMRDKLIEQFIYTALVRRIVIFDGDFFGNNLGILNEGDNYNILNFDFERSFRWDLFLEREKESFLKSLIKNLKYVKNQYPHVYNKFVHKSEMLKYALRKVKQKNDNKTLDKIYEDLGGNLNRANRAVNFIEKKVTENLMAY